VDQTAAAAIKTSKDEIAVGQQPLHATDIGFSNLEVKIEAGDPNGRDAQKVADLFEMGMSLVTDEPKPWHALPCDVAVLVRFIENSGFVTSKQQ
jgi:hypothetical protein